MTNEQCNKLIETCNIIAADAERDAKEADGMPFDGKTVAMYLGYHGAAINALANIIKQLVEDLKTKNNEDI